MADMVLTSLKITPKRSEAVDFSIPFLETGITIIVSIRKGNISPTAFLGLFSNTCIRLYCSKASFAHLAPGTQIQN
jgi:hypothetical protein